MIPNILLALGVMIAVGFFGGVLAHRLKFPRVTGYIVVGVILSPALTGIISKSSVEQLHFVTTLALGIIAYSIGGSLGLHRLRQHERAIACITPLQAIGALSLTALACVLILPSVVDTGSATFRSTYLPMAIVIGAIASATAPATILAIVRELKAKGPVTTTLLSVVAVDDAVAIILFSMALGIARGLVAGGELFHPWTMLGAPALEIAESVGLGLVIGLIVVRAGNLAHEKPQLLVVVLGAIATCVGLTEMLGASPLLANMVLGATVANLTTREDFFKSVDYIEDAVFAVFFVLSGLHFSIESMRTAGLIALAVVIARGAGKYSGCALGARAAGSPPEVRRYLGLALLPAAGVALGLGLVAQRVFPETGSILYNTVLAMVIINELLGPPFAEQALLRTGEGTRP